MFVPILDYVKPLCDSYTTYLPCVSGLTADQNFWCSRVFLAVLRVFRGIMGCSGVLWDVPWVFRGCSGLFRAVPVVFRGCSGVFRVCSGFYRHPNSQGDPQKSYEELGIFRGLRLRQFVSSLTSDHYFWCSGGVPCCFEGVPGYYGMFQGCSGVVPGCSGVFQGCSGDVPRCSGSVPGCSGCSGFYRHP